MKCVQNTKTKEIRRVNDALAFDLVKDKKWSFIPKSIWKEKVRNNNKTDEE